MKDLGNVVFYGLDGIIAFGLHWDTGNMPNNVPAFIRSAGHIYQYSGYTPAGNDHEAFWVYAEVSVTEVEQPELCCLKERG